MKAEANKVSQSAAFADGISFRVTKAITHVPFFSLPSNNSRVKDCTYVSSTTRDSLALFLSENTSYLHIPTIMEGVCSSRK